MREIRRMSERKGNLDRLQRAARNTNIDIGTQYVYGDRFTGHDVLDNTHLPLKCDVATRGFQRHHGIDEIKVGILV